MPDFSLYFITMLLYAMLGVHAWSSGWLARVQPAQGDRRDHVIAWQTIAIPAVLVLHAALLYQSMFSGDGVNLNVGTAASLIVWLTVLIYWLANFHYHLGALQTLILPVAAIFVVLPYLLPEQHLLPYARMPLFKLHFAIAMLAYSLFTIAALHALLMATLEKRLHEGRLAPLLRNLPSLLTMEALLFKIVLVAFVLLTLTLASGVGFAETLFGRPFQFTHKTIFGFVSWAIFAALLAGRHFRGWRGRIAVRWTLAGFAALLLAYLGSKFVLEVLLHRY